MNQQDVVITGIGPVTSIGVGGDAVWDSLAAGRSRVAKRPVRIDVCAIEELPFASMPAHADVPGLDAHLKFLSEQDCPAYRDLAYTLLAIDLSLKDAGLSYDRTANNIAMAVNIFRRAVHNDIRAKSEWLL